MTDPAAGPASSALRAASRALSGLVLLGSFALLVRVVAAARWVRPAADDWCVLGHARDDGVLGTAHWLYAEINGRLVNGLLNGVVYAPGPVGERVLVPVLVLGMLATTLALVRQGLRVMAWPVPLDVQAAAAACTTALLLTQGGHPYQTTFWAPGVLSHTVAPLLGAAAAAQALSARRRGAWARRTAVAAAFLTAAAMGTLSEPFAAVAAIAAATTALALAGWAREEPFVVAWPVAWLVGTAAGFAVLLTSPGISERTARPLEQPGLLSGAGVADVFGGWASTWAELAHHPGYLGVLATGALVGAAAAPTSSGRLSRSGAVAVWLGPLVLVALASLAVVAGLRQGYGPRGWTYDRAWMNFVYPTALVLLLYGGMLGRAVHRRVPLVALLAVAGCGLALTASSGRLDRLLPTLEARAASWDEQDAHLREAVAGGAFDASYTPYPVDVLSEPFRYTSFGNDWVSSCLVDYYHLSLLHPSEEWLRSPASATWRRANPGLAQRLLRGLPTYAGGS